MHSHTVACVCCLASGKNAGHLVAAELLQGLWTNYGPERRSAAEAQGDPGGGGAGGGGGPGVPPAKLIHNNELV